MEISMMTDMSMIPVNEGHAREREAVTRALELDDTSAEAHMALGGILEFRDWNWAEADRELRRAIQLNPNLAFAHAVLSEGLAARGRFEEAVAEIRRARQLSPYDETMNYGMAQILLYARHYDQAIEQGLKAQELFPDLNCHLLIGLAYEQKGDSQHAISELQKSVKAVKDWPTRPARLADLAHAYAVFGNKKETSRLLAELTEEVAKRGASNAHAFAIVYIGLGDKERAFEWLDKAYDERSFDLPWIKADPRMDPLRSDPRYQELLLRLGLPR
jgi:tetratricopeptide (TPR) repeat protein